MKISVINHVTLDGVMQAPGEAGEDIRGGFKHGGWAVPRNDPAMFAAIGDRMSSPDSKLLLGHWSYQSMLGAWNAKGGPFKEALNRMGKYVVSKDPNRALQWPNSTLIHDHVPAAVAELKREAGGYLVIMGSGELIRSLMPYRLIDEYLLMVHPIVLGSGVRLFGHEGVRTEMMLTNSFATTTGVVVNTLQDVSF